jgi:Na+/H+-dicarboxylate symporter
VVINRLAPFGVFAIIASATGTMRFDDLERLQVYMVTYPRGVALLTFWILPGLAASLTPFNYKDFLGPTRAALITAFATGNIFVVLPVLAERSKELLRKLGPDNEESETAVDVIIPTSFSFPNLGKILTWSFVLFAGWFSDSAVPISVPHVCGDRPVQFFWRPHGRHTLSAQSAADSLRYLSLLPGGR